MGGQKADPNSTVETRTKYGRMASRAVGLPFFDIGIVPWEKPTGSLAKACWAEFVSMLLFIYLTTGAVCFGCHSSGQSNSSSGNAANGQSETPVDCFLNVTRVLQIATSFGLSLFVLVYAAAPFSGGHLNPAVSLAFFLTKKLSAIRFLGYVLSQLAGSILGSYLVKYTDLTGFAAATGGANRLLAKFPSTGGWLIETILTFTLVLVIFVATDQRRGQSTAHVPILAPAAIGFTLFACHLAAVPIDGCSVNPARSFGPAVTSGHWTHMWIFWAGPFSGAAISAAVYELVLRPSRDPILTIDRHDDSAQTSVTAKLPGYTGASGLPSNTEAMEILQHRQRNDTADEGDGEVLGSGHVLHNSETDGKANGAFNGTANGNGGLSDENNTTYHNYINGRIGNGSRFGDRSSHLGPNMV